MIEEPSKLRVLGFAFYALPVVGVTSIIASYVPGYYSEHSALDLATIGAIFFFLRIFDFVTDFPVGAAIDARLFRWGKYRPWLIISMPLLMAGVYLVYLPTEETISVASIVVGGVVLYSGFTFAHLSHNAWGSDATRGTDGVSLFFGFREVAVIIGLLIAFSLPAIVEARGGFGFKEKVNAVGYYLLAAIPFFGLLALYSIPDSPGEEKEVARFSFDGVRRVMVDRVALSLVFGKMFFFAGLIATTAGVPFLLKYYFEFGEYLGRAQMLYFVTALLSIFIWMGLARRFGELVTARAGILYAIVVHCSLFLVDYFNSLPVLFGYFLLAGPAFGVAPYLFKVLLGRLATRYEEAGQEVRGVLFAFIALAEKLGGAFGLVIMLPLLQYLGFDPKAENSPEVTAHIFTLNFWVPMTCYVFTYLCISSQVLRKSGLGLAQVGAQK